MSDVSVNEADLQRIEEAARVTSDAAARMEDAARSMADSAAIMDRAASRFRDAANQVPHHITVSR